tara:strand:- start:5204 stop:5857 length:654 start_codon:yes stop_codon:yes gene_type:complete
MIYDELREYLLDAKAIVYGAYEVDTTVSDPYLEPVAIKLPQSVIDYLDLRRNTASNVFCRSQDTVSHHLSWHYYLTKFMQETPTVDMIAWELLYRDIVETTGLPLEAIHCMEIKMNSDPAHPYAQILKLKEPLVSHDSYQSSTSLDANTTPEYVALAHVVSEELELDITELHTPMLVISHEDMGAINHQLKQMFGSESMDAYDVITSIPTGQDVYLA